MRYRLVLEYDGAGFCGWQRQSSGRSVQGVLEQALGDLVGAPVRVHGAGRTDAGVHARGQVAHLDADTRLAPPELARALNARLPDDLAVRALGPAAAGFHARRDALGKTYRYRILVGPEPAPLRRLRTWHLRGPLDCEAMAAAARPLLGTHDFAAYRGAPGGVAPGESSVRSLERLDVERCGDELRLRVEGRSFLRHMVRNLVGTLVEVGLGRRPVADPARVLAAGQRAGAGPTAPAHGLCLEEVRYRADPGAAGRSDPLPTGSSG